MVSGMTEEKTETDQDTVDGKVEDDDDSIGLKSVSSTNSASTTSRHFNSIRIDGIKEWMSQNDVSQEEAVAHLVHQYNKLKITLDQSLAFLQQGMTAPTEGMAQGTSTSPTVFGKASAVHRMASSALATPVMQEVNQIAMAKATASSVASLQPSNQSSLIDAEAAAGRRIESGNTSSTEHKAPDTPHDSMKHKLDIHHKNVPPAKAAKISPEQHQDGGESMHLDLQQTL